jgi:uncharacterized protein YrzB (UPF0473 family)
MSEEMMGDLSLDPSMLITLIDEDGVETEFEILDSVEYNGNKYVALMEYFEDTKMLAEAECDLVILKVVTDENGEEVLESISDDSEFDEVADIFEDRLDELEDLEDEDE